MNKLTKELLLEAVTKSIKNASQLLEEGKILMANKRFARAYSLYKLSIEEIGKASMCFEFLFFEDYKDGGKQKKFLKAFRDHKMKTKESARIDFMLAMAIGTNEIKRILIENAQKQIENNSKLNDLKNYSLYTSIIDDQVVMPDEVINEKSVNDLEFYAEIRYQAAKQYYNIATSDFEKLIEAKSKIDSEKLYKETEQFLSDLYNEEK